MIKILTITLLITACGTELDDRDFETTDPEFILYLESFAELYGKELTDEDVVIGFVDQDVGYGGKCYYEKRQIEIDKKMWDSFPEFRKEALIFHELGHCILNIRDHDNSIIELDGKEVPNSLMNENILGAEYYFNKEYYINELFNR